MDDTANPAARQRSDEFIDTALAIGFSDRARTMLDHARRADPNSMRIEAVGALMQPDLAKAMRAAAAARRMSGQAGSGWQRPEMFAASALLDFGMGRQHRVAETMAAVAPRIGDITVSLAGSISRLWWASAAATGSVAGIRAATSFASCRGVISPVEEAWLAPIVDSLLLKDASSSLRRARKLYPGVIAYLGRPGAINPALLLPRAAEDEQVCGAVLGKALVLIPGLMATMFEQMDLQAG
ncbi:hypothetical protein [Bosea sp. RAC05]|uniref:hypothetical protein n=1 Tax=Bosea sp. RAC05 TaxID=1842539 RepID=UPI00083D669B|nr:hypothetical protein [Bosea sp. RAC05]AOG03266.1 hypothetical protein BSY19_5304 [Bosea sp. RAC05]